jgi:hypothetical protein
MTKPPFIMFLLAGAALACGKSNDTPGDGGVTAELQAAEATWASAKASCSSYQYTSTTSSVFGSCAETTVHIANDKAVGRSFLDFTSGGCGGGDAAPAETWSELSAQEVGTHSDGAAALTVEQLFAACQTSLSHDPKQNTLTLTIGPEGVPTACGYTPINCVDDCYMGFRLSGFACGEWTLDAATP